MPNVDKVLSIMQQQGLSKSDLAQKCGIGKSLVTHILQRQSDVRESTLKKLCKGLGCKAEDIW